MNKIEVNKTIAKINETKRFIVSSITFRSLLHFVSVFFVYCTIELYLFHSSGRIKFFSAPLMKKIVFSQKNHLHF